MNDAPLIFLGENYIRLTHCEVLGTLFQAGLIHQIALPFAIYIHFLLL